VTYDCYLLFYTHVGNQSIAQRNNTTGMWSCKTTNPPSHVSFLKFILAAICGYYGRGDCASLSWCPWRCNCKRVSSFPL
jgi:hypothetical protein